MPSGNGGFEMEGVPTSVAPQRRPAVKGVPGGRVGSGGGMRRGGKPDAAAASLPTGGLAGPAPSVNPGRLEEALRALSWGGEKSPWAQLGRSWGRAVQADWRPARG